MSVTPRRFSSRATFALTVVLGRPSRRAAPLKLPAWTTFTKIAMPPRSIRARGHYAPLLWFIEGVNMTEQILEVGEDKTTLGAATLLVGWRTISRDYFRNDPPSAFDLE